MAIHDYIGMRLTGRHAPLVHVSDAESFGAPEMPGFAEMFAVTSRTECVGETAGGVPVAVAIGDNQASFLGSVKDAADSVLVNMGTGGQISAVVETGVQCQNTETRPYVDGGALLVGFSLCGGRAYALLEKLFCEIAELAGALPCEPLYEKMNALAEAPLADGLRVSTLFSGTRADPSLRGSIAGINDRNLTPAHLVQGVLRGMAEELLAFFPGMRGHMLKAPARLVGSGNAIRKNSHLQRIFEEISGLPMSIPAHREEAAYGAALFAMAAAGLRKSVADAQKVIKYL